VGRLKRLLQRDADGRRPGAFERVKLRRRLDRQERLREALLLDLGAIIFELHRQRRREPELLQAKAAELDALDEEIRTLAHALDEGSGLPELTASGLVATCTACASLMGSRDRFCSRCGSAAGAPAGDSSGNGSGPPHWPGGRPPWDQETPDLDENPEDRERQAPSQESQERSNQMSLAPRAQDDLVRFARGKLWAGRRAARRWMAERRPEAQ
jgi:hypothetical protein